MLQHELVAGVHESMQPYCDKIKDVIAQGNQGNLTLWEDNFIRATDDKIKQGAVLDAWEIKHVLSMHNMRVIEACPAKRTELGRKMGFV